jgi:hypothetical protein
VVELEHAVLYEILDYLLVWLALSAELSVFVEFGMIILLNEVIKEKITKVNIKAPFIIAEVGNAPKINKRVARKNLLPKGHQGRPLPALKNISLPKPAHNIDPKPGGNISQIARLYRDSLSWIVKNSMSMK